MNVNGVGKHVSFGTISFKGACDWCNKPRAADVTLKQCGGCKVTWYCGKQCQAEAWSAHKYVCTSRSSTKVPPMYATLGLATVAELIQVAKDWSVAHKLSLFMLTTVLVELGGGVDVALQHTHAVVFELGPSSKAYDGSPATAFTLEAMGYHHKDEVRSDVVAAQWSAPVTARREAYARKCRNNPDVAGLVPVTFCLLGSPVSPSTSFPICRPRTPGPRVADERTRAALRALPGFVTPVINEGLVFRAPADAGQVVPDVGKLVWGRKDWVWIPPVDVGARELIQFVRLCESEYRASHGPLDSFTTYHQLWPYHLLQDSADRVRSPA